MKSKVRQFLIGFTVTLAGVVAAATFNLFQPATGILKGSASTYVTTAATGADILSTLGCATPSSSCSSLATASSIVFRDANGNTHANNFENSVQGQVASGTVNMTAASGHTQYITSGSGTVTFVLPDATTLQNGHVFEFNNNASGTTTIQSFGGSGLTTVPPGGYTLVTLLSNSFSAGQWDYHSYNPSNVLWGTALLTYPGAMVLNGATGGSQGAGTVNATGLYINGVAVGGGGTPGGSDTQVQFNDMGSFGGNAGFTFNKTTGQVTISNAATATPALIIQTTGGGRPIVVYNDSVAGDFWNTGVFGGIYEIGPSTTSNAAPTTGLRITGDGSGGSTNVLLRTNSGYTLGILSDGSIDLNNSPGGAGQFLQSAGSGNPAVWGYPSLAQFTVGTLPSCNAGATGELLAVTDALAATYNGALTGGGTGASANVPVYCNGTAWTSH